MSRVTILEEIHIDAEPGRVWDLMGNFGGLEAWFPAVRKCTVTGSGIGAVRRLEMPDGTAIEEEQLERDDAGYRYLYNMCGGDPMPFTDYTSTFALSAEDGGTRVSWSAEFVPIEGAPIDPQAFVREVYRGGLEQGRKLLED